jgi:hypothetical protein
VSEKKADKSRYWVTYLIKDFEVGETLGWFNLLNARWAVKSPYVGEQYIPHIRRRAGHNLSEGETLEISSLTLVCANRRGDDVRNVIAKVNFK